MHLHKFAPKIVVVGVGEAGCNTVNSMVSSGPWKNDIDEGSFISFKESTCGSSEEESKGHHDIVCTSDRYEEDSSDDDDDGNEE